MSDENDEISRAWNGVLFDKFLRFKPILTTGLSLHGQTLLARRPPPAGARVLDLGCGFGDMTRQLAEMLAPSGGTAVGVDVAQNFVESASRDAAESGSSNATFFRADVQIDDLRGPYDAAYSRFGMQFFNSPVAALRNIRRSLKPGATLSCVVWRKREDNPWLHVPELCVRRFIAEEEETADEPTCGPGPFSMRGPDLVSDQFKAGGFGQITFERHDVDICIGRDLDEAIAFAMALGPAGEIMRLASDIAKQREPEVMAAIKEALAVFVTPRGLFAPSSTWFITAKA
jgi:ubiquinone/menaquinone biosynthesis C-methylase UbiE